MMIARLCRIRASYSQPLDAISKCQLRIGSHTRQFSRRRLTTEVQNPSNGKDPSDDGTSKGPSNLFSGSGGIGLHNVRDRVLVTERHRNETKALSKTCTIIGAPMTFGQPYVGTDTSPTNLRQAGLVQKLSALSWHIQDMGNLDFANIAIPNEQTAALASFRGNAINVLEVGAGTYQLAHAVENVLHQENYFPLILGGDHSIGIGSLAGILKARPNTGVLWIDAHADINTPFITESGNMHGMPIGFLMSDIMEHTARDSGNSSIVPGFEWLQNEYASRLSPDQLVYVGLRDVDVEERKLISSFGIKAFTMTEIDRYGIGKVIDMALQHLGDRPLHLSYDIDAVDPILAPATGTAVRGGLTFREAHYVAEAVADTGRLSSAEIVELNPMLSNEAGANDTVDLGLQIILSLMGKSII